MKCSMLESLRRPLVIVAHYDDEALFCGGLLLKLRAEQLYIAVVTDVADTNSPRNTRELSVEAARQTARLAAFDAVCERLNATPIHLRCRNSVAPDIIAAAMDDLPRCVDGVITHGAAGEYGHVQHVSTHRATVEVFGESVRMWGFDISGPETVAINRKDKIDLLRCYEFGGHQVPKWQPWNSDYQEWVTSVERYRRIYPKGVGDG